MKICDSCGAECEDNAQDCECGNTLFIVID